jgi:hypothetical protein
MAGVSGFGVTGAALAVAFMLLAGCVPAPAERGTVPSLVRIESLPPSPVPGEARSRMVLTNGASGIIPVGGAIPVFTLPGAGSQPSYELIQGVECAECDAPVMIWVFRGVPGEVRERGLALPFPGMHMDPGPQDPIPVARYRLFVGACLNRGPAVAIWLTETLRAPMTRTLTMLQATDRLHREHSTWTDDTVRALEADVARGGCREVPGVDQIIL